MDTACMKFDDDDFKLFKVECAYWIAMLGLHEWEFLYVFDAPDEEAMACTLGNMEKMTAVIYFPRSISHCNDVKAMCRTDIIIKAAQHEILEVLLMRIQVLAQSRSFQPDIFTGEVHSVIHRMAMVLDRLRALEAGI